MDNNSHNLNFPFKTSKVGYSGHKILGPSSPVIIKSKEGKSIIVNDANNTLIVFKLWFIFIWFKTENDES